jgi:hypothetical protein
VEIRFCIARFLCDEIPLQLRFSSLVTGASNSSVGGELAHTFVLRAARALGRLCRAQCAKDYFGPDQIRKAAGQLSRAAILGHTNRRFCQFRPRPAGIDRNILWHGQEC